MKSYFLIICYSFFITRCSSHISYSSRYMHSMSASEYLKEKKSNDNNENEKLFELVRNESLDKIKNIIENDNSILNATDIYGKGLLHISCEKGDLKISKYLLSKNIDINLKDFFEETPLHCLCYNSTKNLKKEFLLIGEELIKKKAEVNCQDFYGKTPLHHACSFISMCSSKQRSDLVQLLLKNNANPNIKDNDGNLPFHIAVINGNEDIEIELLNYGSEINAKNKAGKTVIELASEAFWLRSLVILLKNNADVNLSTNCGWNKLHWLALAGDIERIGKIIDEEKLDIDSTIPNGITPLSLACIKNEFEMVKFLISKGASLNAVTSKGDTPLQWATSKKNYRIVKYIINNTLADINAQDSDGWTPLLEACQQGDLPLAKLLIESGGNLNLTQRGNTAFHLACYSGKMDLIKYLLKQKCRIDAITDLQQTALFFAFEAGHIKVVKFLISKGLSIKSKMYNNRNLLHYLASNTLTKFNSNHYEIAKFLLKKGCDPYELDGDGLTAIDLCDKNSHRILKDVLQNKNLFKNYYLTVLSSIVLIIALFLSFIIFRIKHKIF